MCVCVCVCMCVCVCIYNHLSWAGCDSKSAFKRSKTGLN